MTATRRAAAWLGCALVLGLIAWASPPPDRVTDRGIYEQTAARGIALDCTDLHCFRVLVPWVLGVLPGDSLLKWKLYAITANAAAAVMVWQLCLALGLTPRARWIAAAFSLFGFGSLYTLHDVYTADPLMYVLGPFVTYLLLRDRIGWAGVAAAVGVLAKEFVAAPLFVFSVLAAFERRYALAARALTAALAAFNVWVLLQLTLMLKFNYGYGDSAATHLLSGGYLVPWIEEQSPRGVASALFNEFGVLYLLSVAGLWTAPDRLRRLAFCSLPAALVLGYVQQPDRALWNFHFIATPLAATAIDRAPVALTAATVTTFAVANLRLGAQLTNVPSARFTLALSMLLGMATLFCVLRMRSTGATETSPVLVDGSSPRR